MPLGELRQTAGARTAVSACADAPSALADLRAELEPGPEDLCLLFADAGMSARSIEQGLAESWGDRVVHGATSPQVLGAAPGGRSRAAALLLPAEGYRCRALPIDDLRHFEPRVLSRQVREAVEEERRLRGSLDGLQTLAVLILDGLGMSEEHVAFAVATELGETELVGASVASLGSGRSSYVLRGTQALANAGTLLLLSTTRRLQRFRSCSVRPGSQRVVVTSADPERRIVHELDALPAAERLAQLLTCKPGELTDESLAQHPFVLGLGGHDYARPVLRVLRSGSLVFGAAIEEGIVLRLGEGGDVTVDLAQLREGQGPGPDSGGAVLAFDSLLRWRQLGRDERSEYAGSRAGQGLVGLTSIGEQWGAVHRNQTLTGVIFG